MTIVIHAAAIKDIRICENRPSRRTSSAAAMLSMHLGQHATRILLLSTEKAVNAVSLYGATKLCGEKMFVQANAFGGEVNPGFVAFVMEMFWAPAEA